MAKLTSGNCVAFFSAIFLCLVITAGICNSSTAQVSSDSHSSHDIWTGGKVVAPPGTVLIGDTCENDQECVDIGNTVCIPGNSNKVCACKTDLVHHPDRTKCLKKADTLDEVCEDSVQCQAGNPGNLSYCLKTSGSAFGACKCFPNATSDPSSQDTCYKKAEVIGDTCELDIQCAAGIGHSHCFNRVCMCDTDYVSSTANDRCLPKRDLSGRCEDTVQCIVENASCQSGECKCNNGYLNPTGDNTRCYRQSLVDGSCEHQVQCPAHSQCSNQICACENGFISKPDRSLCLPLQSDLGGDCADSVQCQVQNAECVTGQAGKNICTCSVESYVESIEFPNTCVEIIKERNVHCDEDIQCSTGLGPAGCRDGFCQCRLFYGYYRGKCYLPAKLDERCDHVEQCFVGVNNLAVCTPSEDGNRRCRCLPGTKPFGSENSRKCYATRKVDDPCQSNTECTVTILGHVQCDINTKTCVCQLGYLPNNDKTLCSSGFKNGYSFIILQLLVIALGMQQITFS